MFHKGVYYRHPKRGPGRQPYRMSDEARHARLRNLSRCRRLRCLDESAIIKRLIWQALFDDGPRPSQRVQARQLGVARSYVCKVQKQRGRGLAALVRGQRVTLDDLEATRRITAKLRAQHPALFAPSRRFGPT